MEHLTGQDYVDGQILIFDKPYTWTSFYLVKKVRGTLQRRYGIRKLKVGHAGTLDPLATGLMIIATGKATKKSMSFRPVKRSILPLSVWGLPLRGLILKRRSTQYFRTNIFPWNWLWRRWRN